MLRWLVLPGVGRWLRKCWVGASWLRWEVLWLVLWLLMRWRRDMSGIYPLPFFFSRYLASSSPYIAHTSPSPSECFESPPGEYETNKLSIVTKNIRHKDERRSGFSDREYPDNNRNHHHHHHRSSLDPREIKDEIKEKLTDFFSPGNHHESGKRNRSYSGGAGGGGSRRSSRR